MSNLPPFTLVYQSRFESQGQGDVPAAESELTESVEPLKLDTDFQRTLLSSLTSGVRYALPSTLETIFAAEPPEAAVRNLRTVVNDLKRAENVERIALWDLDTRAGRLPQVISALNASQPVFTFFELQGAPLPAALIARDKHVVEWVRRRLRKRGRRLSKADREAIQNNLIVNDFYQGAQVIHDRVGVNYLVGITQSMIAGDDEDGPFWNYFTASNDRILMISAFDLRRYAKEAGRPFEVALAMLLIAQLMVAVNANLGFHESDDTGCIFDMNILRANVVACIRDLKIDDECLPKMARKYREAALSMLDALREIDIDDEPGPQQTDAEDARWLKELDKLSEG